VKIVVLLTIAAAVGAILCARVQRRQHITPETRSADRAIISSIGRYALIFATVFMLYVVSYGPVGVIAKRCGVSAAQFRRAYFPVFWLGQHTGHAALGQLMGRYSDFWAGVERAWSNETVHLTGASGSAYGTNRTSSAAGSGR
jgi:hypothetical protein